MARFFPSALTILLLLTVVEVYPCTTFIVSGKFTTDGRPILYKHRDTGESDNALVKFSDGKYEYVGLVNDDESSSKMVWGGYNSAGFAIMNSAAYNNNIGDTTKLADREGVVMKLALQNCVTLKDFETLLDTLPKPLGVDANFGVIDANGGAAYYETGNYRYVKADVNDPLQAPYGFLVRTNHSFSGAKDKGFGYIRYQTAYNVLFEASAKKLWDPQYLINHISRNLTHSLTHENLEENLPVDNLTDDFKAFSDFIPRNSSTSVILVIGAKTPKEADQVVMWAVVGFPLTAMAVPIWLGKNIHLPEIVNMQANFHARMCDAALQLKSKCFPIERGSGKGYINRAVLVNQEKNGYLQLIQPAEKIIFSKANKIVANNFSKKEIKEYYNWLDSYVSGFYQNQFGLTLLPN